jgi:hypothetical protein
MTANIVCLKWGRKYSAEYVNRLYRMVQRTLSSPYRFVCVTDDPRDLDHSIETKPIVYPELDGWWHKITLFQRKLYDLEGRTLFLDLDMVIVHGLDNFLTHPGDFCIIRDWNPERYNSSVFRLEIGSRVQVWEQFVSDYQRITQRLKGDQDWLKEMIPDAVGWPTGWVKSFTKHLAHGAETSVMSLPAETLIIAFHGYPKPHEVIDAGVGTWKQASLIAELWGANPLPTTTGRGHIR